MELNKIYNEDCITYMKSLPDKYVDLIIADPPYFQICGDFDYIWKNVDEYINWCKEWINKVYRVLKELQH